MNKLYDCIISIVIVYCIFFIMFSIELGISFEAVGYTLAIFQPFMLIIQ